MIVGQKRISAELTSSGVSPLACSISECRSETENLTMIQKGEVLNMSAF